MLKLPTPAVGATGQRLVVSSSMVQFVAMAPNSGSSYVSFMDDTAIVTFDGSTPSATNGHEFPAGSNATWANVTLVAAKFIRKTGDVRVHASPMA